LTLLALVLAIGLVVDDAIVMLENIYRHIEEGMDAVLRPPSRARVRSALPSITMTLTLVAVYAPLAFTPGAPGGCSLNSRWRWPGAVVVSGFVALTLTPMMCSLLLKHNPKPNWFDRNMERWLTEHFGAGRIAALAADWRAAAGPRAAQRLGWRCKRAGWWVSCWCQRGGHCAGLPRHEAGTVAAGRPRHHPGQRQRARRRHAGLHQPLRTGAGKAMGQQYKEFDRIFANVGNPTVSQASVVYRTVDWDERKRSTLDMARELQPKFNAAARASTPFPSRRRRWGRAFASGP
jgi:multidrug efflux pump